MNNCVLYGRLTNNPQKAVLPQGSSVVRFGLAVRREYTKKNEVDFFECQAWNLLGDNIDKYVSIGDKILVSGRFQNNFYINRDGVKVRDYIFVVERFEFGQQSKNNRQEVNQGYPVDQQQRDLGPAPDDGFMNIPDGIDEELPFS